MSNYCSHFVEVPMSEIELEKVLSCVGVWFLVHSCSCSLLVFMLLSFVVVVGGLYLDVSVL